MNRNEYILDKVLKYAAYNADGELVARQPYGHKYRMKIDGQLRTLQSWSYIAAHGKPASGRIVSTSATENSIDPRFLHLKKEVANG